MVRAGSKDFFVRNGRMILRGCDRRMAGLGKPRGYIKEGGLGRWRKEEGP